MSERQSAFPFRPTLRPTLFTIPALAILIALGTWQVHRLAWKRALLHEITSQMAAPPVVFPTSLTNPEAWAYRRVRLTGQFDNAHEMYLYAGGPPPQGGSGYDVITPLKRPEGEPVLVNRGWVPAGYKNPATRVQGQIPGTVTVTGVIELSLKPGIFTPASQPAQAVWYVRNIPSMARYLGYSVAPAMVAADTEPRHPGGLPIGGQTRIDIPNHHLQYALTWYGLAMALLVIYVVYHWRRD